MIRLNDQPTHLSSGAILVYYQDVIDRKVYVEARPVASQIVVVINIFKKGWKSILEVEHIKTKQTFSASVDSFRNLTNEEMCKIFLEKRLPELNGVI